MACLELIMAQNHKQIWSRYEEYAYIYEIKLYSVSSNTIVCPLQDRVKWEVYQLHLHTPVLGTKN